MTAWDQAILASCEPRIPLPLMKRKKIGRWTYRYGAFQVWKDGVQWIVIRDEEGGADNPLAYCRTLREACGLISRGSVQ